MADKHIDTNQEVIPMDVDNTSMANDQSERQPDTDPRAAMIEGVNNFLLGTFGLRFQIKPFPDRPAQDVNQEPTRNIEDMFEGFRDCGRCVSLPLIQQVHSEIKKCQPTSKGQLFAASDSPKPSGERFQEQPSFEMDSSSVNDVTPDYLPPSEQWVSSEKAKQIKRYFALAEEMRDSDSDSDSDGWFWGLPPLSPPPARKPSSALSGNRVDSSLQRRQTTETQAQDEPIEVRMIDQGRASPGLETYAQVFSEPYRSCYFTDMPSSSGEMIPRSCLSKPSEERSRKQSESIPGPPSSSTISDDERDDQEREMIDPVFEVFINQEETNIASTNQSREQRIERLRADIQARETASVISFIELSETISSVEQRMQRSRDRYPSRSYTEMGAPYDPFSDGDAGSDPPSRREENQWRPYHSQVAAVSVGPETPRPTPRVLSQFKPLRHGSLQTFNEESDVVAEENQSKCIICFTNKLAVLQTPCNHINTCRKCWNAFLQTERENGRSPLSVRCMSCREPIKSVSVVFFG